jgi:methionine synthase II (cobalamin-independent)
MFATLIGTYPPDPHGDMSEDAVRQVITELEEAGLEPLSDGQLSAAGQEPAEPAQTVRRWELAARSTTRAVKQALLGPYSQSRESEDAGERIRETIDALVAAGCPLIEIEEPHAVRIGDSPLERRRFADAHRRLTDGLDAAVHLSLVLTGGDADTAGAATFFDLPYASYAFDLIAGPDNWRLVAQAPGDRGIVCGALDPRAAASDAPEVLVWAAHYAASTGGRGIVRVGLANASGLGGLTRERARQKAHALGEAARLAAVDDPGELAALLNPRAVDIRSAATGRYEPKPGRPPGPR